MYWVGSCWRNLPPSGAGMTSLPDHTIYLLSLPIKHCQNTVRAGLRSLIQKNCDLAHHCTVPENVRRTARRNSAPSPPTHIESFGRIRIIRVFVSSLSILHAQSILCESALDIERWESCTATKSCGTGSARMQTMIDFFHNGAVDPNHRLETDREKHPSALASR